MPDKFFIHVHLDLPDSVTDMVGNAKAVLAGNDLRIAIEALVKEKAETAILTFGVQKENLPAPPKAARKPRAPKAPQPIPGMEPSANVDAPVTEPEKVMPPGVDEAALNTAEKSTELPTAKTSEASSHKRGKAA